MNLQENSDTLRFRVEGFGLRVYVLGFRVLFILGGYLRLILNILHDLSRLQYPYSPGLRYLESCWSFSMHRSIPL